MITVDLENYDVSGVESCIRYYKFPIVSGSMDFFCAERVHHHMWYDDLISDWCLDILGKGDIHVGQKCVYFTPNLRYKKAGDHRLMNINIENFAEMLEFINSLPQ